MNEHFLVKLPKDLQTHVKNDPTSIQIKTIDKKIVFVHNEKNYSTIYHKLPTIIEAHKTMDKKQFFKVADISNCLYVTDSQEPIPQTPIVQEHNTYDAGFTSNLSKEEKKTIVRKELQNIKNRKPTELAKKIFEISGISQSLLFCKLLNFRKKNSKALETERRDCKVQDLLLKEGLSSEIKIIYKEEDVSSLAAEIEYTLKQDDKVEMSNDIRVKMEEMKSIEEKIKIKEEQLIGVSNVILKRRFEESLAQLRSEYEKVRSEISEMENLRDNI